MNVWGYILLFVVGATAFILILAVLANLTVAWAARRFSKKTLNAEVSELEKLLPGKNCGKCGCETCVEYAKAIFACRMDTDRCTEGDADLPDKLQGSMAQFQKILDGE